MANPIACQVCGENPDADFMVTARTDSSVALLMAVTQSEQSTIGLCMDCWIGLAQAVEMARNLDGPPDEPIPEETPAPAEEPAEVGEEPKSTESPPDDDDEEKDEQEVEAAASHES